MRAPLKKFKFVQRTSPYTIQPGSSGPSGSLDLSICENRIRIRPMDLTSGGTEVTRRGLRRGAKSLYASRFSYLTGNGTNYSIKHLKEETTRLGGFAVRKKDARRAWGLGSGLREISIRETDRVRVLKGAPESGARAPRSIEGQISQAGSYARLVGVSIRLPA